jgi:hypothetical protein
MSLMHPILSHRVRKTLRRLGNAPYEVHASLHKAGTLFGGGTSFDCPVALYLNEVFDLSDYGAEVVGAGLDWAKVPVSSWRHGTVTVQVDLPRAVREFVDLYDRGYYA